MHSRPPTVERRGYPCWAIIEPATDVPGKWVAHCLEFDTLAQADDPERAVQLLLESTNDIVLEDLRLGVDPLERRAPPDDEGWALLEYIVERPRRFDTFEEMQKQLSESHEAPEKIVIAVEFFLSYQRQIASSHLTSKKAHPFSFQARARTANVHAV